MQTKLVSKADELLGAQFYGILYQRSKSVYLWL